MLPKIFFFHNPKAAGSSIIQAVSELFSASQRCGNIENNVTQHSKNSGEYESFRGFDFYCGHYGVDVFKAVNSGHATITNFRHPFTRIASLYNYFRYEINLSEEQLQTDTFFAVNAAKTLTFDEFVRSSHPLIEIYIQDHHFRQLTGSGWSLELHGTIKDALELVNSMAWFYVAEHPELSMNWGRKVLMLTNSVLPSINVTTVNKNGLIKVSNLEHTVLKILADKCHNDLIIYYHAASLLTKRTISA